MDVAFCKGPVLGECRAKIGQSPAGRDDTKEAGNSEALQPKSKLVSRPVFQAPSVRLRAVKSKAPVLPLAEPKLQPDLAQAIRGHYADQRQDEAADQLPSPAAPRSPRTSRRDR